MSNPTFYSICGYNQQSPLSRAFEISSYSAFMTICRGDKFRTPENCVARFLPPNTVCEVLDVQHEIFESEHPSIEGEKEMEHVINLTLRPI